MSKVSKRRKKLLFKNLREVQFLRIFVTNLIREIGYINGYSQASREWMKKL